MTQGPTVGKWLIWYAVFAYESRLFKDDFIFNKQKGHLRLKREGFNAEKMLISWNTLKRLFWLSMALINGNLKGLKSDKRGNES